MAIFHSDSGFPDPTLLGGSLKKALKIKKFEGLTIGPVVLNGDSKRSIWVWTKEIIDTEIEQTALVNFCLENGCNTIYADAFGWIGGASWDPVPLQQFISSCTAKGISVYAAWGNTDWGDPTTQPWIIANVVENYEEFQALGTEAQKFDGMVLDVEYWTDEVTYPPSTNLPGLLDLVKNIQGRSIACGLFSAFYLKDNTTARPNVTYDLKSAQDGEHMMDVADFVVVGSYRDTAADQIAVFQAWHDYASIPGNNFSLLCGAETTNVSPADITYFGSTKTTMEAELASVSSEFKIEGSNAYLGVSIHDYVGWSSLAE